MGRASKRTKTEVKELCGDYYFLVLTSSEDEDDADDFLVPRKVRDINKKNELPGRRQEELEARCLSPEDFHVVKWDLTRRNINDVLLEAVDKKKTHEWVIGTDEDIWYDRDWGFFGAILACYNNHWVLKTCPDDWWNVVVGIVASTIDGCGNDPAVRRFFVDHEGQKDITIFTDSLSSVDFNWLFDEFSQKIRENIAAPGYVDTMQADFSTTTPQQLVSSQIALMSSMQKYFSYGLCGGCGIPGVEMLGTQQDWEKLIKKFDTMISLLMPIMPYLDVLQFWEIQAKEVLCKLLETYKGKPVKEWWGHILSRERINASGSLLEERDWHGWIPGFLGYRRSEFRSGIVSVPITLTDISTVPHVEDTGVLVAGTVGFTVEEGRSRSKAAVVAAKQGWCLVLPQGSPITSRLTGGAAGDME